MAKATKINKNKNLPNRIKEHVKTKYYGAGNRSPVVWVRVQRQNQYTTATSYYEHLVL